MNCARICVRARLVTVRSTATTTTTSGPRSGRISVVWPSRLRKSGRDSSLSVAYVANYLYHGLSARDEAVGILTEAHQRGILELEGRDQLATYLQELERWQASLPLALGLVEDRPNEMRYRVMAMRAQYHSGRLEERTKSLHAAEAWFREHGLWQEAAHRDLGRGLPAQRPPGGSRALVRRRHRAARAHGAATRRRRRSPVVSTTASSRTPSPSWGARARRSTPPPARSSLGAVTVPSAGRSSRTWCTSSIGRRTSMTSCVNSIPEAGAGRPREPDPAQGSRSGLLTPQGVRAGERAVRAGPRCGAR